MSTKITNITLTCLIVLWLLLVGGTVYSALILHENSWILWSIAFGILFVGLLVAFLTLHDRHLLKHLSQHAQLIRTTAAALGYHHEIIVFDENGQTVFTTHPHAYPHKREFLRKIMLRISPTPEATQFKLWVDECQPGICLLVGGGDGLGQQKRWWLSHVSPLDPSKMNGKHFVLVTLTDVTSHLDGYDQVKNSYKQVEGFIDNRPAA